MAPEHPDFAPEELAMLRSFFRDEAAEALEVLTSRLLQAGTARPDDAAIAELMRTTHTLKGSAGTVGLHQIVDFAHALEDRFAQLRSGMLPWSRTVLDCIVETVDALRVLVDDVEESSAQEMLAERVNLQLTALDRIIREASSAASSVGDLADATVRLPLDAALAAPSPPAPAYPRPDSDLDLDRPPRRGVGDRTSVGGGIVVATLAPEDSTHSIVTGGLSGVHEIADGPVPSRVIRVEARRIDQLMDSAGELVFDRTRIERRVQNLRGLSRDLGRLRQELRDGLASLAAADDRAERQTALDGFRQLEDRLAKKVTQLSQMTGAALEDTESLRRTSAAIQEGLTRVRMLSAGSLFQRLAPPLRSIARAEGKRIRLTIAGEETEFDKTVAEQITDPLIQLLRNAVAHGIESAEVRQARDKPPEGNITITAYHAAGLAVVEVSDDGAGIDPEVLRTRLVASRRWTQARAQLATSEDILRTIFDPGMSTRDQADQLAGRGVGLDAVRETISRIGGEIRMTSTPGRGTTFVMRMPVTTAVSQALLFKIRGHVYALPSIHILDTTEVPIALGCLPSTINFNGEELPLLSLHQPLGAELVFDLTSTPAMVIEYVGKRFAVSCDKVVGPRQIVVKDLGPLLAPLPLYAGATISGSGKVQMILDPAALLRLVFPAELGAARRPTSSGRDQDVVGRALVVDDSRAICEAMTRILARSGYIVDVAEDGARAWDMLRELSYDIVLTDLEMPRMNGFDLIERMRGSDALEDTPVVIISSRAAAVNRRRARQLGVHGFIAKPVTRRKVLDAVKKALES